jgi:hypothetical protein
VRRLVWHFKSGEGEALGILHEGRLVNAEDRPLPAPDAAPEVRLWHPWASTP